MDNKLIYVENTNEDRKIIQKDGELKAVGIYQKFC